MNRFETFGGGAHPNSVTGWGFIQPQAMCLPGVQGGGTSFNWAAGEDGNYVCIAKLNIVASFDTSPVEKTLPLLRKWGMGSYILGYVLSKTAEQRRNFFGNCKRVSRGRPHGGRHLRLFSADSFQLASCSHGSDASEPGVLYDLICADGVVLAASHPKLRTLKNATNQVAADVKFVFAELGLRAGA